MILALKTDNPVTELYLLRPDGSQTAEDVWESGNQLSQQLLEHIRDLLVNRQLGFSDLTGIVAYRGPGSFTGLRIGLTVANTIAYSQQVPIVGPTGDNWLSTGVAELPMADPGGQILPEYGAEANITKPKK